MRERINRLAKGIVDMEVPKPRVSVSQIQECVNAGEVTRKEISISDTDGLHMKGLVYSSNTRVRVKQGAFGGSRNHISYEVDSTHLVQGDVISGAFFFVTNGGERKIPYEFSVNLGVSGKTLSSLVHAEDFGDFSKKDLDTALRLFEYKDFVEAPFMQEMHIRTLYDGLKGHANQQNLLEEFLVALHVKEPVELFIDTEKRFYHCADTPMMEQLEVRTSTWGYVQFTVETDGDFLELQAKTFTLRDFKDGLCKIPFSINPGRLHHGKNLGALTVSTIRSSHTLQIEVQGDDEACERTHIREQEEFARYVMLRLEYESGIYEDRLLINQMHQELERMRRIFGETILNQMLQAELCLMEGQKEHAQLILENCKKEITDKSQSERNLYCYYQYLMFLLQKKDGQRENLLRLVKHNLAEGHGRYYPFFVWLRIEPSLREDPADLLNRLREQFRKGCNSPFLYGEVFRIYEKNPQMLRKVDDLELQVLLFAVKRERIEKEFALQVAALAKTAKHYHKLFYRILVMLYEQFPELELLSAICCLLIKGDRRESTCFCWYQDALDAGISLTGLYEYYLYSLPGDYSGLLPKEVLLYFSYEKELDDASRSLLYMNILKYMKPEAALYKQYERDIERFAMNQLLQSRIDRRLVVLYQHMIYREMIDEQVARVLPAILNSYRVRVKNPNIKYVIVCYEELKGEDAFPIRDGVAYVPLFLEHTVLLFQDVYGNRYADIPHRKLPAMEKPENRELVEQCYEIYPNHPMLRLQECEEIVSAGVGNEADLETLRRASGDLDLHPLYQSRILSKILHYYQEQLETEQGSIGGEVDYLLGLDMNKLTGEERAKVCETLIYHEYIKECYEIIRTYGVEGITDGRLLKLCTRTIMQNLFNQDDMLLQLACNLFSKDLYDSVVLDYLCEHFNGSSKQMFKILNHAVREHVDIYDMPERLLAQMMFTGETEWLDQVFDWYASGKTTSDNIVRAYFTLKSVDYFVYDKPTGDRVFAWLEGGLHGTADKSKVPTIYLLALTKYYAGLQRLDEERTSLCKSMVELLLSEDRVFPYFKKLGSFIPMPDSVMTKEMIEYRSSQNASPELLVRVLPDEEDYGNEPMKRVYPRIFVRQKVLFEGEIMEYQIYETQGENRVLVSEGSVICEPNTSGTVDSRLAMLNEMGLCMAVKEERTLKEKMKKYLTDDVMMEELFSLL